MADTYVGQIWVLSNMLHYYDQDHTAGTCETQYEHRMKKYGLQLMTKSLQSVSLKNNLSNVFIHVVYYYFCSDKSTYRLEPSEKDCAVTDTQNCFPHQFVSLRVFLWLIVSETIATHFPIFLFS